MTIKHRIEQLEQYRPPESKVIDEWLEKHAEPFESDEEKEETFKILEKYNQDMAAYEQKKRAEPPTLDISMNQYPKLMMGILELSEMQGIDPGK